MCYLIGCFHFADTLDGKTEVKGWSGLKCYLKLSSISNVCDLALEACWMLRGGSNITHCNLRIQLQSYRTIVQLYFYMFSVVQFTVPVLSAWQVQT